MANCLKARVRILHGVRQRDREQQKVSVYQSKRQVQLWAMYLELRKLFAVHPRASWKADLPLVKAILYDTNETAIALPAQRSVPIVLQPIQVQRWAPLVGELVKCRNICYNMG